MKELIETLKRASQRYDAMADGTIYFDVKNMLKDRAKMSFQLAAALELGSITTFQFDLANAVSEFEDGI